MDRGRAIRVGIVDDHPAVLASVAAAIDECDDLAMVGAARTLAEALALAPLVDVLVCDLQIEGRAEGLQVLDAVHLGATRTGGLPAVIILTGFEQPSLVRAAIEHGAAGYLDKSAELQEILGAIRTVASGGSAFTAAALRLSRTGHRRPSEREIQVIERIVAGATNAEVAAALGLSEKTIESHLRRLFDRYGLVSRTELAVLALEERWTASSASP